MCSQVPTLSYAQAQAGALYTVVMVDRDALSASAPYVSPIRHWVYVNVSGQQLLQGYTASNADPNTLSNYLPPGVCSLSLSHPLVFRFVNGMVHLE